MKTYQSPNNIVELLQMVIDASNKTNFYRPLLNNYKRRLNIMDDFQDLPITCLQLFRMQHVSDVTADPGSLQWVVGPRTGHKKNSLAVIEGVRETGIRYDLFRDAIRGVIDISTHLIAAVITPPDGRYFASEISTILGYSGIQAHVLIIHSVERIYEMLEYLQPNILTVISTIIEEPRIPRSVQLCITFNGDQKIDTYRQLDMYHIDEFGFLGHSYDLSGWIPYNDQYLFETSGNGNTVVTALHNHIQPLLRLDIGHAIELSASDGLHQLE